MFASIAELALMLVLWVLFLQQSSSIQAGNAAMQKNGGVGFPAPPYYCCQSETYFSGDIMISMKLFWSRTALRAFSMFSAEISFTAASYSLS